MFAILESIDPELLRITVPFLFVFAVVYGVLTFVGIFEKQKNVNVVLALLFGIVSATYSPLVDFLMEIIPIASIIAIVMFLLAFFFKLGSKELLGEKIKLGVMVGILIFVLLLVGGAWPFIEQYIPFDSQNVLWIIGIIVVLLLFFFVGQSGGHDEEKREEQEQQRKPK